MAYRGYFDPITMQPDVKDFHRQILENNEPDVIEYGHVPQGNEHDWSEVGFPPVLVKQRPTKPPTKNKTSVLGDLDPYNAYKKDRTVVARKKKNKQPEPESSESSVHDDSEIRNDDSGSEIHSDLSTPSDESDVDTENDSNITDEEDEIESSDAITTEEDSNASKDDDDDESEEDSSDEDTLSEDSDDNTTDSDDESDSDDSDETDNSEDSDESDVVDESDEEDDDDDADDGDNATKAVAGNLVDSEGEGEDNVSKERKTFTARLKALPTAVNLASSLAGSTKGLLPFISAALFGGAMAYFPSTTQALLRSDPLQPPAELQHVSGLSRSSEPFPILQRQPETSALFSDWFNPSHGIRNLK